MGECRHRPCDGPVCYGNPASLVAGDGCAGLPQSTKTVNHSGRGREQRLSFAGVESGCAGVGRYDWLGNLGVPLSTWDKQMEQDRTSHVLPHHPKLAWQTAEKSGCDSKPNWKHQNEVRFADSCRAGCQRLQNRDESFLIVTDFGEAVIPNK